MSKLPLPLPLPRLGGLDVLRVLALLALSAVAGGIYVWYGVGALVVQPQWYHDFAGPRVALVLSNVAFVFVGLTWACIQLTSPHNGHAMYVAAAITATGFGSAMYHLMPADDTLLWDRLPMALVMGALVGMMASARFGVPLSNWLSVLWSAAAVASVLFWYWGGGLLPYAFVQGATPLLILLTCWPPTRDRLHRLSERWWPEHSSRSVYAHIPSHMTSCSLYAILWYALAKAVELLDNQVFAVTRGYVSGHTLKHLLAACALRWLMCGYLSLQDRLAAEQRDMNARRMHVL